MTCDRPLTRLDYHAKLFAAHPFDHLTWCGKPQVTTGCPDNQCDSSPHRGHTGHRKADRDLSSLNPTQPTRPPSAVCGRPSPPPMSIASRQPSPPHHPLIQPRLLPQANRGRRAGVPVNVPAIPYTIMRFCSAFNSNAQILNQRVF